MTNFKIGDKVSCIDSSYSYNKLKKNSVYTVLNLLGDDCRIILSEDSNNIWNMNRFKLVEPEKFIVMINDIHYDENFTSEKEVVDFVKKFSDNNSIWSGPGVYKFMRTLERITDWK